MDTNEVSRREESRELFKDLHDEGLKIRINTKTGKIADLQREKDGIVGVIVGLQQEVSDIRMEQRWRELEKEHKKLEDGFYTVRVTEDTNRFFYVSGDGLWVRDLTDDSSVDIRKTPLWWTWKPFHTDDGYL